MNSPKGLQQLKQYYAATAMLLLNVVLLSLVLNMSSSSGEALDGSEPVNRNETVGSQV